MSDMLTKALDNLEQGAADLEKAKFFQTRDPDEARKRIAVARATILSLAEAPAAVPSKGEGLDLEKAAEVVECLGYDELAAGLRALRTKGLAIKAAFERWKASRDDYGSDDVEGAFDALEKAIDAPPIDSVRSRLNSSNFHVDKGNQAENGTDRKHDDPAQAEGAHWNFCVKTVDASQPCNCLPPYARENRGEGGKDKGGSEASPKGIPTELDAAHELIGNMAKSMVLAVMPLQAIVLSGRIKDLNPELQSAIHKAVNAINDNLPKGIQGEPREPTNPNEIPSNLAPGDGR